MITDNGITSHFIEVQNTKLHYLSAGSGEPILCLHGWPTSAYLWRNIMPALAQTHQVIALDLPGFGRSDKPLDVSYSFTYYYKIIEAFTKKMGIKKTGLVVHDLGGPLGLLWAVRHPEKVSSLTLLNTLVYPEISWAAKLFVVATILPGIKSWMSSPTGIARAMRFGVHNKSNLTDEILAEYQAPFEGANERKALLKTPQKLSMKGFREIEKKLPQLKIPVCLIYGANDRILPDVAETMQRVKRDLPQAQLTELPNCGHFLQEDEPEKIGKLLAEFLNFAE
jgi:pimeloyl-ACP methyl ester carboxylesterase